MVESPDHDIPFSDRRGSFRCPVAGARGRGLLRLGEQEIAIDVRDESASGLSIVLDGQHPIAIGERLLLEIDSAWTEVEVRNCRQQEVVVPGDAGEPASQMRTCLGLKRLRDLESDDYQPPHRSWRETIDIRALLERMLPLGRQFGGVAAVVAGIFVTGFLVVWTLETSFKKDPKQYRPERPLGEVKILPLKRTISRFTRPERTIGLPKWSFRDPGLPSLPKQPLRLPSTEFLLSSDVVDELQLTGQQIEALTRAMQQAGVSREPVPGEAFGLESSPTTVELAPEHLDILSESQRLSLKRLVAASQALPSAADVDQTLTREIAE